MDLDLARPREDSVQKLTMLLFRQGNSLVGRNLRKSSWEEIATAVCGNGKSSDVIWSLLQTSVTRNDAIKVLRLARKHVRQKISDRQIRGKIRRGRVWRQENNEVSQYDDDYDTFSDLEICRHCHRSHCDWYARCETDTEERDAWWHTIDSHLSDLLFCRAPLIPDGLFPKARFLDTGIDLGASGISHEANVAVEDRLNNYVTRFAVRDQDIRPELSQSIHDTKIISRWLEETHPKCSIQNVCKLVCLFAPFWVMSPRHFNPKGGRSLFDHLFSLYDVPQLLQSEWLRGFQIGRTHQELKWLYWHILVGQGASLKRAAVKFGWRIIGRFQQYWEQFPGTASPLHACIHAEIRRLGGTEVDFHRVICNPAYVVDPTEPSPDQSFWQDAVRWLIINRDELNDPEADLILTWAMHEFTERQHLREVSFWKGRTASAAVERSREYQRLLARPWSTLTWPGHGWDWSANHPAEPWSFVELTSGDDLYLEGSALHHCVVTYAGRCAAGHSAIVSMRRNGARCLTIEIDPQLKQILQARGFCNRAANQDEEQMIRSWFQLKVCA